AAQAEPILLRDRTARRRGGAAQTFGDPRTTAGWRSRDYSSVRLVDGLCIRRIERAEARAPRAGVLLLVSIESEEAPPVHLCQPASDLCEVRRYVSPRSPPNKPPSHSVRSGVAPSAQCGPSAVRSGDRTATGS